MHCRDDFRAEVSASPPRTQSRAALAVWACEQHNAVSAKLGKPPFPCTLTALDLRWRASPACDGHDAAASLGQGG